ncbi:MAG: enoyl-CoA hydratase/isomerase family protein [Phototrophicaceae bacterium]|jgi:enoyl-CoA hydratase
MTLVTFETPKAGIALLTFNRPDKLNAFSTPLLQLFESHLRQIEIDPTLRVVILTGAGEKAFVAGADIGEYAEADDPQVFIDYQLNSRRLFDYVEAYPKPIIAAINGYALGGGFEIALCCDVLITSTNARLGLPEGLLGLCPGGGGTQRLTRAVGPYVAADVLLSGNRLSGQRAYELGLAAQCVELSDLMDAALKKADYMLKVAPLAQREIKRLIRLAPDASLPTGLSLEQEVLFRLYNTQDGREGISAFVEKREPNFKGR